MPKDPILPRHLNKLGLRLDLLPIRIMPHISCGLARLLHLLDPLIPTILIRPQRAPHIRLASLPQHHRDRDAVFQRLRCALRARRQERVRGVAQQADAPVARSRPVPAHPVRERVAVDELPVHELLFGRLGDDARAHGVPGGEECFDFGELAGEAPAFVYVVLVAVGEDPAAVAAAFERAEEEVDVGSWGIRELVVCREG
jgi:hypothetical protein